jgi:SAM-dependent methyltransferase
VDRFAPAPRRSLAVGIGASAEAEMLARRTRLVAVDLARPQPRCGELALAVQADASRLPFAAASFDAVFAFDVLEHIQDEDAALEEVRRVLRPDGSFVLSVPAFPFLFGRQDVVCHHHRRYRRSRLVPLLQAHGFSVDHASYFNSLLFLPVAAIRAGRRLLRTADPPDRSDFDLRLPRPVERLLEKAFSAERHLVTRGAMPFGVSLLCVARTPAAPRSVDDRSAP